MNYCSECGRDTDKKETIKQKFVDGELWNGHQVEIIDNAMFLFSLIGFSFAAVLLTILGLDYLMLATDEGDFEQNLQLAVFLLIIAAILTIMIIGMIIYDRGLRQVLKFLVVTFTLVAMLLTLAFVIWELSEIILGWVE